MPGALTVSAWMECGVSSGDHGGPSLRSDGFAGTSGGSCVSSGPALGCILGWLDPRVL
ncbi:hypothetical protein ABG768_006897, partial [Culter alburnus]